MHFTCPVCLFDRMPYTPTDYHICPCCSTEFENDDVEFTWDELRNQWIDNGARWFYGTPPPEWNPWVQLARGSFEVRTGAIGVGSGNTTDIGIKELQVA